MSLFNPTKEHKIPDNVRTRCINALEQRRLRGKLLKSTAHSMAVRLVSNRTLPTKYVEQIHEFFKRSKLPNNDEALLHTMSNNYQLEWALFGGNEARVWAKEVIFETAITTMENCLPSMGEYYAAMPYQSPLLDALKNSHSSPEPMFDTQPRTQPQDEAPK
jgi:hypothetical protein